MTVNAKFLTDSGPIANPFGTTRAPCARRLSFQSPMRHLEPNMSPAKSPALEPAGAGVEANRESRALRMIAL